jgi:uncharacterized protein (TIGR04222 family)
VVEAYLAVCGALLLGSVLARWLPAARHSFDDEHEDGFDLTPRELGYLRRGPYGVVLTVLAELHGIGAVDATRRIARRYPLRPGRGIDTGECNCDDRLALAVYAGLTYTRSPRLLALLPSVRQACAPLRWAMRDRGMLPAIRHKVFSAWLLLYAVGCAVAAMIEFRAVLSTVVAAAAVVAIAGVLLGFGPRRTLAGSRELRLHRGALARVAKDRHDDAAYLADLVAAFGAAALHVLCGRFVASGALAPPMIGSPAITEPKRPEPVPAQRVAVQPVAVQPLVAPPVLAPPRPVPICSAEPVPAALDWDRPHATERHLVGAERRAA